MRNLNTSFISITFTITIISVVYAVIISNTIPLEERAIFGDMFGALTALFSGLAFAAIIVTLNTQQKIIATQKEELKIQRSELKNQQLEFKINRISNLINFQLNKIEYALEKAQFENETKYPTLGINGVYYINEKIASEKQSKNLDFFVKNSSQIIQLFDLTLNSTKVINKIIETNKLSTQEANQLKFIFLENIGNEYILLIQNTYKVALNYIQENRNTEHFLFNYDISGFLTLKKLSSKLILNLEKHSEIKL